MVAAFSGLFIGTSAIHAAQRGLNVTGQNIANSSTEGYTRQRIEQEAVGGPGVPAFWSRYDGSGEGVRVTGVTRMTDQFLVARANNSNAALGELEEQQKTMAALERVVNEPSDTGLQKKLAEMWNAFGAAGNSPSEANEAPRAAAVERAREVAAQLHHMGNSLATQWKDTAVELQANVTDINSMAKDIARLNVAIRNNDIARVPSNELLDQRDVLVAKLADLTGATVRPAQMDADAKDFRSQAVDVMIGNKVLVYGTQAGSLKVTPDLATGAAYDYDTHAAGGLKVEWATAPATAPAGDQGSGDTGMELGRVAGQLTSLNKTIPDYMNHFDSVAEELAQVVNAELAGGEVGDETYTAGYTVTGETGQPLFTAENGTFTARSITVANTFQPNDLAVSEGNPKPAANSGIVASLDGNKALALSRHINDKSGADSTYNKMVVQLGVEAQSVNRNVLVQQNVVQRAEDARDNVSGVSLNEEMTNMIQYQHSFAAAAKFVSAIDQVIDTLINMKR